MPEALAISCWVSPLPRYEEAVAVGRVRWYFGLNLSLGWHSDPLTPCPNVVVEALKAWAWNAIDRLQVRVERDADGAVIDVQAHDVFVSNKRLEADGETQLITQLNNYVNALKTDSQAPHRSGFAFDLGDDLRDDTRSDRSLYETLSYWNSAPHPIGESLNLCRSFWVELDEAALIAGDAYRVFAAPEFTDSAGARHAFHPATVPTRVGTSAMYQWPYEYLSPFEVCAYVRPAIVEHQIPLELPTYLTDKDLLRKCDGWLDISTQPWLAFDSSLELETHTATACDLGQRLIDAFRSKLVSDETKTLGDLIVEKDKLSEFRSAVVAVLRDTAGVGNRPIPSGTTLLDYYLYRFLPPRLELADAGEEAVYEGQARSFYAAVQAWDAQISLADWCNQLRAALGSTRLTILGTEDDKDPPPVTDAVVMIEELDRLQSQFASDDRLAELVLLGWRQAVARNQERRALRAGERMLYFHQWTRQGTGEKESGMLALRDERGWALTWSIVASGELRASLIFRLHEDAPVEHAFVNIAPDGAGNTQIELKVGAQTRTFDTAGPHTSLCLRVYVTKIASDQFEWQVHWGADRRSLNDGPRLTETVAGAYLASAPWSLCLANLDGAELAFALPDVYRTPAAVVPPWTPPAAWDRFDWEDNKAAVFLDRDFEYIDLDNQNEDRTTESFSAITRRFLTAASPVRKQMLLANIGIYWRQALSYLADGDVDEMLARVLDEYFHDRCTYEDPPSAAELPGVERLQPSVALFKIVQPENTEPPEPNDNKIVSETVALLKKYAESISQQRLAAHKTRGDAPQPRTTKDSNTNPLGAVQAHPVVLLIDDPGLDPDDEHKLEPEQVGGVFVMARDAAEDQWRALNSADIYLEFPAGDADAPPARELLVNDALIPIRPVSVNGQQMVAVEYNNRPLPVADAAALEQADSGFTAFKLQRISTRVPTMPPGAADFRLRYGLCAPRGNEWTRLPELRHGRALTFAAWASGTSLAHPPKVANVGRSATGNSHPAELLENADVLPGAPHADATQDVRYLRLQQPGAPRMVFVDALGGEAPRFLESLPAIPEAAHPLSREIPAHVFAGELTFDGAPGGAMRKITYELDAERYASSNLFLVPSATELLVVDWRGISFRGLAGSAGALVLKLRFGDLSAGFAEDEFVLAHDFANHTLTVRFLDDTGAPQNKTIALGGVAHYDWQACYEVERLTGGDKRLTLRALRCRAGIETDWLHLPIDHARVNLVYTPTGKESVAAEISFAANTAGPLAYLPPRLLRDEPTGQLVGELVAAAPPGESTDQLPLLLMTPRETVDEWPSGDQARHDFRLAFGSPTAELELWSRWSGAAADRKARVWADVHRQRDLLSQWQPKAGQAQRPDGLKGDEYLALSDPAIAGRFLVELVPLCLPYGLEDAVKLREVMQLSPATRRHWGVEEAQVGLAAIQIVEETLIERSKPRKVGQRIESVRQDCWHVIVQPEAIVAGAVFTLVFGEATTTCVVDDLSEPTVDAVLRKLHEDSKNCRLILAAGESGQRSATHLQCEISADEPVTLIDGVPHPGFAALRKYSRGCKVTVLPGEVWELRVYPLVEAKYLEENGVDQRFHHLCAEGGRYFKDSDNVEFIAFEPARTTIEGAIDPHHEHVLVMMSDANAADKSPACLWLKELGFQLLAVTPADLVDLSSIGLRGVVLDHSLIGNVANVGTWLRKHRIPIVACTNDEAFLRTTLAPWLPTVSRAAALQNDLKVELTTEGESVLTEEAFDPNWSESNPSGLRYLRFKPGPALKAIALDPAIPAADARNCLAAIATAHNRVGALPEPLPQRRALVTLPITAPGNASLARRMFKALAEWAFGPALEKALWKAVQPEFVVGDDGKEVLWVDFDRRSGPMLRYLGDIDLLRQWWRWQGRPVSPFPSSVAEIDQPVPVVSPVDADPSMCPLYWDAEAFADRTEDDHVRQRKFVPLMAEQFNLHRELMNRDQRALYQRYGAVGQIRYAGLLSNSSAVAARRPIWNDDGVDRWRRLRVGGRFAGNVTKPCVRFLLPLTESEGTWFPGSAAPGVLVVLDEEWYRQHGLAETLEAEVQHAQYYANNRVFSEFGADPILDHKTFAGGVPPTVVFDVSGPIGTTFDTTSTEPLYGFASFLVTPRTGHPSAAAPSDDLGWFFFKLRFRRKLEPTLMAVGPGAVSDEADRAWRVEVASDLAWPSFARTSCRYTPFAGAPPIAFTVSASSSVLTIDANGVQTPLPWRRTDRTSDFRIRAEYLVQISKTVVGTNPPTYRRNWTVRLAARTDSDRWTAFAESSASIDTTGTTEGDNRTPPESPELVIGGANQPLAAAVQVAQSEASAAYWVQTLPNAARFRAAFTPPRAGRQIASRFARELRFDPVTAPDWEKAESEDGTFSFSGIRLSTDASGKWIDASLLVPEEGLTNPPSCRHEYWLAVTEQITDIRGNPRSERFVAVMRRFEVAGQEDVFRPFRPTPQDDGGALDVELTTGARLRVRVMCVQYHADKVGRAPRRVRWSDVFGEDRPQNFNHARDALGRIVSVSPPIDLACVSSTS